MTTPSSNSTIKHITNNYFAFFDLISIFLLLFIIVCSFFAPSNVYDYYLFLFYLTNSFLSINFLSKTSTRCTCIILLIYGLQRRFLRIFVFTSTSTTYAFYSRISDFNFFRNYYILPKYKMEKCSAVLVRLNVSALDNRFVLNKRQTLCTGTKSLHIIFYGPNFPPPTWLGGVGKTKKNNKH